MKAKSLMAALAGAIVVFIWSSFSWMILPWHMTDMKNFKDNGNLVMSAVQQEAVESGIYILPNLNKADHNDKQKSQEWVANAQKGPFAYMSIKTNGTMWDMRISLLIQFISQFLVAIVAVCLLKKTNYVTFLRKAWFVCYVITAGAFLVHISLWNWWSFPTMMTLINIVDTAITWFLAGLVIAKIVRPTPLTPTN